MNIFKQLIVSLYSPKDIAKFRFQGIGKTILYVFFITLISTLPSFLYLSSAIIKGIDTSITTLNEDFPNFEIKDGKLFMDAEKPIEKSKNGFLFIMDDSGNVTSEDFGKRTNNGFAILHHEFAFVGGGTLQTYPYSMLEGIEISKSDLSSFLHDIDNMLFIFLPILGGVTYIFSAGLKFIEISILAVIGLLMNNSLKRNISYRHVWRLSAYSVTLPTVFFTIMALFKTNVVGGIFIHWFVTFVMLYLIIKEIPKPKKNPA
jgi:hypothetical protein